MEQKQKDALWAQYTKQTHRLGRGLSLITVALLLGALAVALLWLLSGIL